MRQEREREIDKTNVFKLFELERERERVCVCVQIVRERDEN